MTKRLGQLLAFSLVILFSILGHAEATTAGRLIDRVELNGQESGSREAWYLYADDDSFTWVRRIQYKSDTAEKTYSYITRSMSLAHWVYSDNSVGTGDFGGGHVVMSPMTAPGTSGQYTYVNCYAQPAYCVESHTDLATTMDGFMKGQWLGEQPNKAALVNHLSLVKSYALGTSYQQAKAIERVEIAPAYDSVCREFTNKGMTSFDFSSTDKPEGGLLNLVIGTYGDFTLYMQPSFYTVLFKINGSPRSGGAYVHSDGTIRQDNVLSHLICRRSTENDKNTKSCEYASSSLHRQLFQLEHYGVPKFDVGAAQKTAVFRCAHQTINQISYEYLKTRIK